MLAHESGAPQLVRQLDLDEAAAPAAVGAEDTSLPAQSPAAPTAHPPRQAPPASPPGAPSSSAGAQQVLSPTNGRQPGASRRESLGTSADKQAAAAAATTVRRRRTGVAFADPPASILRRPRPQEQQQEQRWAAGGEQPSQQLHGGVDVEELARRLEALGLATQRQQQQLEQRDAEIAQLREQLQQTAQVQAPQGAVRRRAARLQPPQLPGSLESPTDSEASDVVPAAGYRRTRRPVHLSSSDSSSEGGLDSEEDCDSAAPRLRQRPFRPSNLASRNGTTQPATAPDPRRQQQSGRTGAAAAPSGRQLLPPGSRTPSALLMSNGELLHMPWDVVYAVVEDQNWQHALSVKVEPRGGTLGPLEKPVQLDPEKEFWVSSESPNLSVLAALPTLGSQKPCLKPTRMALKLHLVSWQAALGGVEDAATEEVFAFEARYSSSAGGQQVMKVARISALAKWSARSALADGFSLYSFVDPLAATALYEVARIVVLARQGEEVWSQLEEQGKLQIQIFSVDFFGSTASGQHAVARR
ncbi:hypothetical protein CHLNCDRAFT_141947 [Chlorella variabilis]|uniref:Uncharacterized protein n=1 Tax=Chlorella variabilis TaxID=554065 RepID=E1Z7D8_CHLVA|nr:hypothetical protein CHLNCDRAFT_141947 [Chlorella variabilis]EFN57902.1 hypothetical protein CHLNCDRAFT_141947 [Chlorella variabilis]|eukprot:XP_005850004.1 hypothetical protein CHLNCDRAFT_141947 [Chlorella variabilis]